MEWIKLRKLYYYKWLEEIPNNEKMELKLEEASTFY